MNIKSGLLVTLKNENHNKKSLAFTIVELLVVIVVIGILAAITIVSYSGISNRAIAVGLQSDLSSDSKLLKMYNVEHGYYPDSLDASYCPNAPTADSRYCLKASNGNTLAYSGGDQEFTLIDTHTITRISYKVTEDGAVVAVSGDGGGITTDISVQTWGGAGADLAQSITKTSDGGYAIAGSTTSYGAGSTDAFIAKYGSDGKLSWNKTWGGTDDDYASSIVQTSDGGFAIAGDTYSFGAGGNDAFIAKYTSDGTLSWSRTWGGTAWDCAYSITLAPDGGLAIAGDTYSYSTGDGDDDAFIAKYTSDGTLSWSKTWGGASYDNANSITRASDDGYFVTGTTQSFGAGSADAFIAKYTSDGTLSWSKTWGGADNDDARSIVQTSDGGFAIAGDTYSYSSGKNDAFIAKYASDGTLSWSKTWGGADWDYANSIIQTSDGGYAITGDANSYGVGASDSFIAKYTSDGTLSWNKTWGGTDNDFGQSLFQNSDGGYTVAGITSYGAGSWDAFVAKYNSEGTIDNCLSSMCQDVSASISSPSAEVSDPSVVGTSPSLSTAPLSATVTTPDSAVTRLLPLVPVTPITSVNDITGTLQVSQILTAGNVSPAGATVSYQWQSSTTTNGDYTDIAGATNRTYVVSSDFEDEYLRVVVTGNGDYSGTQASAPTSSAITSYGIKLISIAAITGTLQVSQTLTAGNVSPAGATVSYQWQRSATPSGDDAEYTDITGANNSTYTLSADDINMYLRVVARGDGEYSGIQSSAPTSSYIITNLVTHPQTIVFSGHEIYVAYPGESQTVCKEWTVPNGKSIKGFSVYQASEQDYDFFTVSVNGIERYNKSGFIADEYTDISASPGTVLSACMSADDSYQGGYGGEVTSVFYE